MYHLGVILFPNDVANIIYILIVDIELLKQ